MYYRGYVLIRLKMIGTEWKVVEKIQNLKSKEEGEDWRVTYASPVYGGWDIIVECAFAKLEDLDKIVTFCRVDEELSDWIEETTTLCGTRANFEL